LAYLAVGVPLHAGHEPVGIRPDRTVDESRATCFVSVNGDDSRDGRSRETAFATLQKAADAVEPGDTVLVTSGVYRQTVHIKKEGREDAWIQFIAEPGAVILGSDVRKDWKREPGELPVFSIPRPRLHSAYQRPEAPMQSRTEQVFVDGRLLYQVPEPAMLKPRGVFHVDDRAERLRVCLEEGRDPNEALTEVSVRTFAIALGGPPNINFWRDERVGQENRAAYIRIDGFTVRHIANFSRMAAIQIRGLCHHIVIENCDVQWVNYCAVAASSLSMWDPGRKKWFHQPAHHVTIRNSILSNNGVAGAGSGGVSDLLVESNLIDNNNYKGISPWSEGGAVKTGFDGARIVLRNNVARNNHNHGLWIDYGSTDSVIENNFVANSMAGGILNEVTPCPPWIYQGEQREHAELTAEEVRGLKQNGTVIRNNVVVGTRPPGGGGINISGSNRSVITNNILYGNSGGGLNYGGSPSRAGILGLYGNIARNNIFDANDHHASTTIDEDDPKRRQFDNRFESNLFLGARASHPFRIGNQPADRETWDAFVQTGDNHFSDAVLLRDPERFDFTLLDAATALRAGFDPGALRLDWSEFYLPTTAGSGRRSPHDYHPLDLSAIFSAGLPASLTGFPSGRQTLDGVDYILGSGSNRALAVGKKPAVLPVGRTLDELVFLFGSSRVPKEDVELARLVIHYQDGTNAEQPVVAGRQIRAMGDDPTWREFARLNDHQSYVAWQGRDPKGRQTTVYYLRWINPEPGRPVGQVSVRPADAILRGEADLVLLGLSAATLRKGGKNPGVFHLSFDGDVDAVGSDGREIEAQGFNRYAFAAGTFTKGVRGQAFVPTQPIHFQVPADFPLEGTGTILLWLRAEDWTTPERRSLHQRTDYTRTMTPFSVASGKARHSPWGIQFVVDKEDSLQMALRIAVAGVTESIDATRLVQPAQWFQLAVVWAPCQDKSGHTSVRYYFNGKQIGSREVRERLDQAGEVMWVGVPSNGGQPWRGAMDDLRIETRAIPDAELAAEVKSWTSGRVP
jgi:hypothetical protein